MKYNLDNLPKNLLFSVEDDCLYLHINDVVIIPFRDLAEWEKFANDMLGMVPEISDNI